MLDLHEYNQKQQKFRDNKPPYRLKCRPCHHQVIRLLAGEELLHKEVEVRTLLDNLSSMTEIENQYEWQEKQHHRTKDKAEMN
jgi:hypothetical protein